MQVTRVTGVTIILTYLPYIVGALGVLFGLRCYRELWKWAKQCQRAEVVVAYNRRVQLRAPLTEWLQWANSLDDEHRSRGRVVYKAAKVSVAVIRPDVPNELWETVKSVRHRKRRKREAPA